MRRGPISLLHARLKVIDLSPAALQPMSNEDGSVWVAFNGEIYNFASLRDELQKFGHTFRSRSDTEVIVHGYEQWGEAVIDRLDGMFALAIWDESRQRLLLARDRAGKKPLFYAVHEGGFYFGSEIKALLAAGVPAAPSLDGLASLLAYGYAPPPGTVYQHIAQLPPAHRMVVSLGKAPAISRYWDLSFSPRTRRPREEEVCEHLRHLLTRAVERRLVSDVPLGAFLSGGVDSSIIVGLMAQKAGRVKTFSIGFQGDARYDETSFARIASQRFGTEHHEFFVRPQDAALLDRLVWHHDGPFGDSSALPTYVVSQKTREHVTVALSGDGGDELFAGYLRFWAAVAAEKVPAVLREVGARVAAFLPRGLPERSLPARAGRFLRAASLPLGDRLTAWNSYAAFSLPSLLRPEVLEQVSPDLPLSYHRSFFPREGSVLSAALYHNFSTYLPHDLLVKMDRCSMAHALEARAPFLDTALMEYVAGLPDDFKLRGMTTKYILKKAFRDLLPPEIAQRGKMGFGVPLAAWFRGELREMLRARLLPGSARLNEYLRPEAVAALLQEHDAGSADHSHTLWLLLTLESWLEMLPAMARPKIERRESPSLSRSI
jgi:asparagine synthase (glutamine-hydrolysing)